MPLHLSLLGQPSRRQSQRTWWAICSLILFIPSSLGHTATDVTTSEVNKHTITSVASPAEFVPVKATDNDSLVRPVGGSPLERSARQRSVVSPSVVWIVLDGVRWQEMTRGMDAELLRRSSESESGVSVEELLARFAPTHGLKARERLMPFIWQHMVPAGQFYGDRDIGSEVSVSNPYWFSYPGYNEMLTGEVDPQINANDFGANPNQTLLEWLSRESGFKDEIGIYATWDEFHHIFNESQSGLPVVAGQNVPMPDHPTIVNGAGGSTASTDSVAVNAVESRVDSTYCVSDRELMERLLSDLKTTRPRVLFVGFGEADTWAHMNRYDQVISTLHQADGFIQQLWDLYQSDPRTRHQTTFIITTDHGRGRGEGDWSEHWSGVAGSNEIWMLWRGPNIAALGEMTQSPPAWQSQIAATIAARLGLDWQQVHPKAAKPMALIEQPTRDAPKVFAGAP